VKQKVAVLPGMPFYVDGGGEDTIRLNFSNPDEEMIKTGISRLAHVITGLVRQ
jgi:2-aminoadipate transaminase